MEKAVSNTSTLIRFYRAEHFLPILKRLFKLIVISSEGWTELQRRPTEPENILMSRDLGTFLLIEEPSAVDVDLAGKLALIMHDVGRGLDYPEALAIAMAHNRNIANTLSENGIARAAPYRVELSTSVYNSLDLLALAVRKGLITARNRQEFISVVERFEEESKERVRRRQLERLLDTLF